MEKEYAPEIYEQTEDEICKIKHRCQLTAENEQQLTDALLDYYEMKKTDAEKASELWGEVQQILDNCDLK